jgi:hypothetical protein
MSTLTAPFRWIGRVLLWIVFFPLGIWRSVVNHSRKKERRRMKFEAEQREKDRQATLKS